jgi:ABC-type Fe3+-siderophore transport system permease subunit
LIKRFFYKYFELVFWVTAMLCLAFTSPQATSHFTLCPLKLMGITWCPGCGLGHSIIYLFHGQLGDSLHAHWLGIPAVLVIFHRIYVLAKPHSALSKGEGS